MNNDALIQHLKKYNVISEKVLAAMRKYPREKFVPEDEYWQAYENHPISIGHQQTISQPYIVARMTDLLIQDYDKKFKKILEIGTGSGYQAAILSEFSEMVYTIERILPLHEFAKKNIKKCRISNIQCIYGDGFQGLKEFAPFDAIILTAATGEVPSTLWNELCDGGKLILPLGTPPDTQRLQLLTKRGKTFICKEYDWVTFVPLKHGVE